MNLRPPRFAWILFCAAFIALFTTGIANAAALEREQLPAKGRQETIVTISDFGRYAISSHSQQGTGLQYINKMSGPSAISGRAGEQDGRIDAFLDVGEYKLVTHAAANGSGEVALKVRPFTEAVGGLAPQLVEHKLVSASLEDLQQRSYWIHLRSRQTLLLEAAGRSLGDLRLWHEGNWLLDLAPGDEIVEPAEGKPLRVKRLSAELGPGLYRLIAYGGPPLPWSETSSEQPFHLRMGIPRLGGTGVDTRVTSPFGYDRWLVSDVTDYFRLELEQNARASIGVSSFDKRYSFGRAGRSAEITKESRLPVAEVFTSRGKSENFKVVTIRANAGQSYTFQRFTRVRYQFIDNPGTYWVSTLHSGYGEDSADATSLLTDNSRSNGRYVDSWAIPLDRDGWQRRFNILEELTLFFKVEQQDEFRVEADGIQGEFRFEPFTTFRSANYKTPKSRNLGESWSLDPGFYILTVIPDRDARGVATLSVYRSGRKPTRSSPAIIANRYKTVEVGLRQRYQVTMNAQPGVVSGILVRKYPLDLSDSMPLILSAGETLSIDVSIPGRGELVAQGEDGNQVGFKLKQAGDWGSLAPIPGSTRIAVEAGLYQLEIRNSSDQAQNYQLYFTHARQLSSTPLPAFDENRLRRPDFPRLTAKQPRFLDLNARQQASFNVIVEEPGLYRLESTGLLQTRGNIRTRVITRLDQQSSNGVGRNFLIQQYLREGNYQLTLAPEGSTEGHLGVQLRKTALIDGGRIEAGTAARYSLPSGEGLVYRFTIPEEGEYRLRSMGTNGYFNARLEDGDGWPLVQPGMRADMNFTMRAGDYRLVVLPTALSARVVTFLEKIEKPAPREGHGPFAMDLNQRSYRHTWIEPAEGEDREPDVWTLELPAEATATLSLSEGMEARLAAVDGELAFTVTDSKPQTQTLPAGNYRIEARARRKNNLLDYRLDFDLEELVVGQRRSLDAPADIDISIGHASLIELSSFGQDDVKARLYDAEANLLASNDDRANDWNFDIIRSLPAGRYRLEVRPVGQSGAKTVIHMSEPAALATAPLSLPAEFSTDSPLIHSYSLDLSAQSGVLAVAAESRDPVSLTLEKDSGDGDWSTIATADGSDALLLAAIDNLGDSANNYRLKVWSPEQRGAKISVQAGLLQTLTTDEIAMTAALDLDGQSWLGRRLAAAEVTLASPGMFVTAPESADALFWAGAEDSQLQAYDGYISGAQKLWLVSARPAQGLKAARVLLQDETLLLNIAPGGNAWLDSASIGSAHELVVAEARAGLPGIGLADANRFDARQMGVGENSTIVFARAPANRESLHLKIWNTAASNTVLPVRLRRQGFAQVAAQTLSTGVHDATLAGRAAIDFDLDGSMQDLRFNLPRGVAAVLSKKGETLRSYWADRSDRNYQVWTDADRLQLFNTADSDRILNIKVDAAQGPASLSHEQMFKLHFASSGIFSLALADNGQGTSEAAVYGRNTELMLLNGKGRVARGEHVTIDGDSVVDLAHGVGLAVAWLSRRASYSGGGEGKPEMPRQVDLSGSRQVVEIERDRPGFINLHSSSPIIARIRRNGLPDDVRVFETGIKTSLFLPQGKNRLQLQSTGAQDLHGVLRLDAVPEIELGEGLGASVGLLPGDARVYRFSLVATQDIGIGVQASVDIARAYLFNQRGETLGAGITQKHELRPGTYYLMVELPPEAASSIEMKPAIVGLEPPDTGPSREVMLEYQKYSSPEVL